MAETFALIWDETGARLRAIGRPQLPFVMPSRIRRSSLEVDFVDVEIEDATEASAAVTLVRTLREGCDALIILNAPQLLAHALYRIGLLEPGSGIVLIDPKEELPYG